MSLDCAHPHSPVVAWGRGDGGGKVSPSGPMMAPQTNRKLQLEKKKKRPTNLPRLCCMRKQIGSWVCINCVGHGGIFKPAQDGVAAAVLMLAGVMRYETGRCPGVQRGCDPLHLTLCPPCGPQNCTWKGLGSPGSVGSFWVSSPADGGSILLLARITQPNVVLLGAFCSSTPLICHPTRPS